jgi:hypothetical protein
MMVLLWRCSKDSMDKGRAGAGDGLGWGMVFRGWKREVRNQEPG